MWLQNVGDYHDLYVETDVALLADVFENFRTLCYTRYKLVPLYARHNIFSNDIVGIGMHKSRLYLNNPVYTGMTILENSKLLMYGYYYEGLYGDKCELLYTDSFLLEIETEVIYEDMAAERDLYAE